MDSALAYLEIRLPVTHALLTRRLSATLICVALFFIALQWGYYGAVIIGAEDLITQFGPVIGGDFVVLHTAGAAAIDDKASLYDIVTLEAALQDAFPAFGEEFRLAWQYPPTTLLAMNVFGAAPYPIAYGLWVLLGVAAIITCARDLGASPRALLMVAASPILFQAAITGQTGMFTAALMFLAGFSPDKRPLIAGCAAGLLTMKPQLGVLIPIAYVAAGAWRAVAVATVVSLGLAALSYLVFGAAPWGAFIEGSLVHGERIGALLLPAHKMTTTFGALTMLGAPMQISAIAQLATFFALASIVFFVWRRTEESRIRFAVLATASVLATPYVFYYELPIVLLAIVALLTGGARSDADRAELLAVAGLWVAPMFLPGDPAPGAPLVWFAAMATFCLVLRRAWRRADVRLAQAA